VHEQARRFTEFVRAHFPDFFHGYNAASLGQVFEQWRAYYHITAPDLYFIGQKHGGSDTPTVWAKIPEYRDPTQPYFVSRVYPGELYTISPELFSTILRRQ
jgi:hypothetical protein